MITTHRGYQIRTQYARNRKQWEGAYRKIEMYHITMHQTAQADTAWHTLPFPCTTRKMATEMAQAKVDCILDKRHARVRPMPPTPQWIRERQDLQGRRRPMVVEGGEG